MNKVVKIENCWMIDEYNNHNSYKIQNGELPSGDVFMVYFLRFLLFCDQCHDFCEDADRNNWIHKVSGKEMIKQKIYDIINASKHKFMKRVKENNELYGSIKPLEISKEIENKLKVEVKPSQIDIGKEIKKM